MFTISFVIVFPKIENNETNKLVKGSSKGEKRPKKEKGKANIDNASVISETVPDKRFIECSGSSKLTCHIDCNLYPGYSFQIDVLCWGVAAKIFTEQEVAAVRCITLSEVSIVCFSFCHAFITHEFSTEDLISISEHTATFKFTEDKNSLMNNARNDNTKILFDKYSENDIENKPDIPQFRIVYDTTPGIVPEVQPDVEVNANYIEEEKKRQSGSKTLSKLSGVPVRRHKRDLLKIVDDLQKRLEIGELIVKDKSTEGNTDGKGKGSSKQKNKGKDNEESVKSIDKNIIKFNATELLVDRLFDFREKSNISSTLHYCALLCTSEKLISADQMIKLKPLTLLIRNIGNIPATPLKLTKIFLKYNLKGIIDNIVETEPVDIKRYGRNVTINHANIVFLKNPNMSTLIEAIQTGVLAIKIYGIYDDSTELVSKVYGQDKLDNIPGLSHSDRINCSLLPYLKETLDSANASMTKSETQTCLLAYAAVDLAQLMRCSFWIRVRCSLTSEWNHNDLFTDPDEKPLYSLHQPRVSPNIINQDKELFNESSYFNEFELIENGTFIKIKAKIDCILQPTILHECLTRMDTFSRIIVISYDQEVASIILAHLMSVNENVGTDQEARNNTIKMITYPIQSPPVDTTIQHKKSLPSAPSIQQPVIHQITSTIGSLCITGFVIDCVQESIIMVEGYTNTTFPRVLAQIYRLDPKKAKVLYNSELVFTKRVYGDYIEQGNIHVITLAEPLSVTLKSGYTYLKGSIPIPAWRTILKLDRIRKSHTIGAVCKNNLLPSSDELLSFELEFGVPILSIMENTK